MPSATFSSLHSWRADVLQIFKPSGHSSCIEVPALLMITHLLVTDLPMYRHLDHNRQVYRGVPREAAGGVVKSGLSRGNIRHLWTGRGKSILK
jgi:hypothetical protein